MRGRVAVVVLCVWWGEGQCCVRGRVAVLVLCVVLEGGTVLCGL